MVYKSAIGCNYSTPENILHWKTHQPSLKECFFSLIAQKGMVMLHIERRGFGGLDCHYCFHWGAVRHIERQAER